MVENAKTTKSPIYDSARRGSKALEELRGIFQYRDLIYRLVQRDIVARYKRSVLGIAWTMLNPLGMMIVLVLVFSNLFHTVQGYPTYLLSGLLAWNFFSQTSSAIMDQMVWGSALFHRIYLPRTVFAVAAICTGLINLLLSLVPLALIMLIDSITLQVSILFLPVAILLIAAFTLGVGLLFSTLAVFFPDVAEMYRIALTAWMYLTPIIYPLDIIPTTYRGWIVNLNPMYYLIETFRIPIYEGVLPQWRVLAIAVAIVGSMLLVGWIIFCQQSDEFANRA